MPNSVKIYGVLFTAVIISGCATAQRNTGLEGRVSLLEERISAVEQRYTDEDKALPQVGHFERASKGDHVRINKDIQLALKNAGLYDGPIDGKIGKATRKAIKAFQEANGLKVDGVAGKETKAKLSAYLDNNEMERENE